MPSEIITKQLKNLPKTSGIYQFFGAKDEVLYIGKAKNLQKRLASYTKINQLSARIARMVFLAQRLETTQTTSELEALLLEHNLIKKFAPKYNILLRDDKTFPQILITKHHFPQITKYRTSKIGKPPKGLLFGPFASTHDVNKTIDVLRKIFLLRNCSDAEFKLRRKPCLEYQIKRCSAPCVSLISEEDYQVSIDNAADFLSGKSIEVQKKLSLKMQILSGRMEYEKAAEIRDQIKSLNAIQAKQNINLDESKDFDVVTVAATHGMICIYVAFFRGGQNFGARPYFYEIEEGKNLAEFLNEFLGQFYLSQTPPSLILSNLDLPEKKLMAEFLEKISGKKTEILLPKRGAKFSLIQDQEQIARQNLEQKISQNLNNQALHLELKNIFNLEKIPKRIEVYDNSHISGTNAVGALITAGLEGFIKSGYRKFNIRFDLSENRDDTAMLIEVLTRRFSKLEKKNYPDLIIIDGGKTQLAAAQKVFERFNLKIDFVCMSKGENRNAGEEWFHRADKESFTLPKQNPVMHYLQRLRDEAHRFAIMTHRKKRAKSFIV
jgi:excinuclease ABC subunit C